MYSLVIIEEAAEVLEPHIVASLSEYCEHVILIGKAFNLCCKNKIYIVHLEHLY